jgi:hypothetical protein
LGHSGDLVAFVAHLELPQNQSVLARPRADQHWRRLSSPQRAAQRLAIQGHDLLAHGGAQALRPAHETLQERLGIQRLEEAVEGVVAGDAARQFQKSFEPVLFGFAKIFHVIEALASAEQRADGDDEQVDEPVFAGALHARVGQILKMNDQA